MISTHTPLTGRDSFATAVMFRLFISTHTPLTGRDIPDADDVAAMDEFLLTRPLRDVTIIPFPPSKSLFISTHTPLTGRDENCGVIIEKYKNFYSHAPYGT